MKNQHTALVLFAGSGGLSRGLHEEGFDALGLDVDPLCVEDHRKIAGPCEWGDLMTMQPHELRDLWSKHYGADHAGPTLLATSPPCKSFSGCLPTALSKTEKYVEMSSLAMRGLWLVLEAFPASLPKLILMENVPRMKTRGAEWLDQITRLLQGYGYAVNLETHDCGEYGALAQVRRRLLLVARHRPQLSDLTPWPKPPKQKHKAIREALEALPVPLYAQDGTWQGGALHRPVRCSALTWLRLALVPEREDWRSIPAEVTIYHMAPTQGATVDDASTVGGVRPAMGQHAHNGPWGVEGWDGPAHTVAGEGSHVTSHWATVADPRTGDKQGTHPGARGVQDWDRPAHTVIGGQNTERNYGNVEDDRLIIAPRLPDNEDRHTGGYGVASEDAPSPTITAGRLNAHPVSVADGRVTAENFAPQLPYRAARQFSQYGVNDFDSPSRCVVARADAKLSWASGADPRLGCEPRAGVYGVATMEDTATTVTAAAGHDNGAFTLADPRIHEGPSTFRGNHGVEDPDGPAHTVKAALDTRNGRGSVADVRMGHDPRAGTLGVSPWDGVSPTIIGQARAEKGNITADPRVTCDVREGALGVGSWDERFRTAVIAKGIPQNGPWQVADPRGGSVRVDGYVVGASVWLRPGLVLDLGSKAPVQMVLLTWNAKKARWAWHRPLTTLELAALQGLTTNADGSPLTLAGKSHTTYRQHIGNMVPPPAARAIAKAAMRCLTSGGWLMMGPGEEVWVDGDEDADAPMMEYGMEGAALM